MAGKMTIYKLVVLGDGGVGKVHFSVPLFSFPLPCFLLRHFRLDFLLLPSSYEF
jgi:hypothetical protein